MTTSPHSKIRVLSDHTINQIAAGEVIENPSSVVKELVENSIDAGSTQIYVEILGGGRQLIRVSDNGCGMSADDAILCFERHATSKIRDVIDIEALITMGFRGEAIPSIASISKFTLLTTLKVEETASNHGTMVIVEGGRLISATSAVRSPGTTIEVKSLFYTVPVRRKFQRSPTYDAQEISKTLASLALGNPQVEFELISDQKTILKTYPNNSDPHITFLDQLKERINVLLGKDMEKKIVPLFFSHEGYQLKGFIGRPSENRANRTGQSLFINKRAVFSPMISAAIRDGYGSMLPSNRFPIFILHFELPGDLVDVNVHPQKREVRIRQESHLRTLIAKAVQSAFGMSMTNTVSLPITASYQNFMSAPPSAAYEALLSPLVFSKENSLLEGLWEYKEVAEPAVDVNPFNFTMKQLSEPVKITSPISKVQISDLSPPISSRIEKEIAIFESKYPIIQIQTMIEGYIILKQPPEKLRKEGAGGLCLLDQRAAFARICYEKLIDQNITQSRSQQILLIPLTLSLSMPEAQFLRENLDELRRLDFSINELREGTFLIDAYPFGISEKELQSCLQQLLDELKEGVERNKIQEKREAHLAWAACRASLQSMKKLTIEEAQSLCDQLLVCQNPFFCPLGKPTIIHLTPKDLSKLFN